MLRPGLLNSCFRLLLSRAPGFPEAELALVGLLVVGLGFGAIDAEARVEARGYRTGQLLIADEESGADITLCPSRKLDPAEFEREIAKTRNRDFGILQPYQLLIRSAREPGYMVLTTTTDRWLPEFRILETDGCRGGDRRSSEVAVANRCRRRGAAIGAHHAFGEGFLIGIEPGPVDGTRFLFGVNAGPSEQGVRMGRVGGRSADGVELAITAGGNEAGQRVSLWKKDQASRRGATTTRYFGLRAGER